MAEMTDIMVDIETTHTNPHLGSIIQLAAIKFNYETGEVGDMFDRCPVPLPFRGWSEGTREFWRKHWNVYEGIIARSEPAIPVFEDFSSFAADPGAEGDGLRFWAKPITFDWTFVASHMEQVGLVMPMHYHNAKDMNSFIGGLLGTPEHPQHDVPFNGTPHNALHDCAYQIDVLMHFKRKFISTEVL